MPDFFCTCSSLITLDIRNCEFGYDVAIAWKSLKSLKFENVVLNDDKILNLLSGCPALENMELYQVEGFRRLEISSRKLRRLILKRDLNSNDHSLDIIAPYLQHLDISGDLEKLKCRLVDVSSVVNAKLSFNIMCTEYRLVYVATSLLQPNLKQSDDEEDSFYNYHQVSCCDYHQVIGTLVQDYLHKLSCASELTLSTWFTQVLCILQLKRMPIPEVQCKYLTLELQVTKFSLYGVAGLLQALPRVETLNIDMATTPSDHPLCRFGLTYLDKVDNIDLHSQISSFDLPNLKIVKIFISLKRCLNYPFVMRDMEKFYELSEFLLMNATVLEKFVIISKRINCQKCSTNCVTQYFSGLAEKLLGCARSSAKSMIIFKD